MDGAALVEHEVRELVRWRGPDPLDAVSGFGPLQRSLDDPVVEELWINDPGRVFVARRGRCELTPTLLDSEQERDLVERMVKSSSRRVDLSTPCVDATLPDRSKLHLATLDVTRAEPRPSLDQLGRLLAP